MSGGGGGGGIMPSFVSSNRTKTLTSAAPTVAYPGTGVVADNVAILWMFAIDINTGTYPSTKTATAPAGFTAFSGPVDAYASAALVNTRAYGFWRRLDGTETGSVGPTWSTAFGASDLLLSIYSDCATVGTPLEQIGTNSNPANTTSADPQGSSVLTTGDNELVLNFIGVGDDTSITTPGTGWTQNYGISDTLGNDTSIYLYSQGQALAGALAAHDPSNLAFAEVWSSITVALKS